MHRRRDEDPHVYSDEAGAPAQSPLAPAGARLGRAPAAQIRRGRPLAGADPTAAAGTGPGPACAMRAQLTGIHPTSRRASSARRNPPPLDSCDPTSHNASQDDITKTTHPGAGPAGWDEAPAALASDFPPRRRGSSGWCAGFQAVSVGSPRAGRAGRWRDCGRPGPHPPTAQTTTSP